MRVFNLKRLVAAVLALTVVVGGAYSIARSVADPSGPSSYQAHAAGAASRIDWSDRINAGLDE